jgi:hypothetical protein
VGLSLQLFEPSIAAQIRRKPRAPARALGLASELLHAARSPRLAARAAWESLARSADELLATGGEAYWAAALAALRAALRELPRASVLQLGQDLRARMAPRPAAMSRARYRKSLQLQLLSAASERLGVPPRAFLL